MEYSNLTNEQKLMLYIFSSYGYDNNIRNVNAHNRFIDVDKHLDDIFGLKIAKNKNGLAAVLNNLNKKGFVYRLANLGQGKRSEWSLTDSGFDAASKILDMLNNPTSTSHAKCAAPTKPAAKKNSLSINENGSIIVDIGNKLTMTITFSSIK